MNTQFVDALKSAVQSVGGMNIFLSFLDLFPQQQVVTLHILANLVYKSSENMNDFLKLEGFTILFHR